MIHNFAVAEYNPYNQWSPVIFAVQSNLHKLSCKRNLNEKDLKISKGLSKGSNIEVPVLSQESEEQRQ
jgi:hypothetical protein